MRTIEFYNTTHLGDQLFHIHYCNKLIEKNDDIEIVFYCDQKYHLELQEWVNERIILIDIFKKTETSQNCWLNCFGHFNRRDEYKLCYDLIYLDFYNKLSESVDIKNPIQTPNEFLLDESQILFKKNPLFYKTFDYMIVNSNGASGQWNYNEDHFNQLFERLLKQGKSIITTKKTKYSDISCTMDYDMSLLDISNISVACDNFILVHTAPHIPVLNIWNMDKPKIFLHNQGITYSFKNSGNINNSKDIINL